MSLDDRLRQGLPRIAEGTRSDVEPALRRAVGGGRRRRIAYRAGVVVTAAVVAAGAVFATPRLIDAFRSQAQPVHPAGSPGTSGMSSDSGFGIAGPLTCYPNGFTDEHLRFSPGYLPNGFSGRPRPGPARGAPPAEDGQMVIHWTDGDGHSVEARNPGTLFAELALGDHPTTITVLGERTANFGPLAPMTEDYLVQFTIGPDGERCSLWSLNEYGLSLDELVRVAEGLVPA